MPVDRPPQRLPRAAVVAASATGLGAAGHALAGGPVPLAGLAAAGAVALAVTWAAAGRERGTTAIAALQVGLQQFVHTVLAGPGPNPGAAVLPHELMFHVHVAAGLLVALLLRAGERRTWAAARRVAARVAARTAALLALHRTGPGPLRRRAPIPVAPPPPRTRPQPLLRHVQVLRGPPLSMAVA